MKKELIYLSLPDILNRELYINYNQRINMNNNINLQFIIKQSSHMGSAIKAIYLLEQIFPKKVYAIKLKIKLKKEFGSSNKKSLSLLFLNLNLTGFEMVDFYRFFLDKPAIFHHIKTVEFVPLVNRKLKLFDYFNKLKFVPKNINQSFKTLIHLHLQ